VLRSKNTSSIPPLPNTPSRHGAQLNNREKFTFTFIHSDLLWNSWRIKFTLSVMCLLLPYSLCLDCVHKMLWRSGVLFDSTTLHFSSVMKVKKTHKVTSLLTVHSLHVNWWKKIMRGQNKWYSGDTQLTIRLSLPNASPYHGKEKHNKKHHKNASKENRAIRWGENYHRCISRGNNLHGWHHFLPVFQIAQAQASGWHSYLWFRSI